MEIWNEIRKNRKMTQVEREHVHSVYSQIAPHFSDTRFKPWPRIAQFLKEQPVGSIIADVGCGNGKYLGVNPRVSTIGSDICPELVSIARTRGHEVAIFDCLNLPYRSSAFDAAICIAVVHHLSTEERRLAALRELVRVVRPGGRILVYVWAMEQDRKKFAGQDVMVPWHLQPKYSSQPHSAPKPRKSDSAKAAAKRAKKAEKLKKKLEKREKTEKDSSDSCAKAEEVREGEKSETGADCLLGELLELCLDEVDDRKQRNLDQHDTESSTVGQPEAGAGSLNDCLAGHDRATDTSTRNMSDTESVSKTETGNPSYFVVEDGDSKLPEESDKLAAQGYRTFQRYYHVFRRGELTQLFSQVEGVRVLEEFYDHENWCVLAERQNTDTRHMAIAK